MRKNMKWMVAGSTVIAVGAMMSVGAGAVSGQAPVASIHVVADHALGGVSGADLAAVSYVNTNYPGSGVAIVLTTSADTEAGVPVYDVRIVAPNGSTYVVHVQQSNDAVLSANLAENQVTTPPVVTPPVITPPVIVPTAITPSEPVETEVESGGSVDNQNTAGSSGDTQESSTTSGDLSVTPSGSSNVNTSVGTQGSSSSSDGSGSGQGVSTSGTSGSVDSGSGSSTNSDG
ncbi:MAG: hypothetical protein ACYDB2_04100 [Acidimicrobiales bacterium]